MLEPSKATPNGLAPAAKLPKVTPSEARSFVTMPPMECVTQMLDPSKATPYGLLPTGKVVWSAAAYQCSVAICCGVLPGGTAAPSENCSALPLGSTIPPVAVIGPFTSREFCTARSP